MNNFHPFSISNCFLEPKGSCSKNTQKQREHLLQQQLYCHVFPIDATRKGIVRRRPQEKTGQGLPKRLSESMWLAAKSITYNNSIHP